MCAFLESPVNDLSHYRKQPVRFYRYRMQSVNHDLDAVFSERINGLQHHLKSVSISKTRNNHF